MRNYFVTTTKRGSSIVSATQPRKQSQKRLDLILEGGGAKGLAHPGAVVRLYEEGYAFERVAGTSAGAITAAVVAAVETNVRSAAKVTAQQKIGMLNSIMSRLEPSKVPDNAAPYIPGVSEWYSLLTSNGVYEGDYIRDWLHGELKALGVETFGDLRRDDPEKDRHLPPYSLVVTATDVTHGRLLRLPWDYDQFNLIPDEQSSPTRSGCRCQSPSISNRAH